MNRVQDNPLFVQTDFTLLLETDHPCFSEARNRLLSFAELIKSPDHLHTYRLTPLSIWNARSAGVTESQIIDVLRRFSKYDVPVSVELAIRDYASRYGKIHIVKREDRLALEVEDPFLAEQIDHQENIRTLLGTRQTPSSFLFETVYRGRLKQALIKLGYPVVDLAGYVKGEPLPILLRETCRDGRPFRLRDYQKEAVDVFHASGGPAGGSGVILLPCGAGKTMVGLGIMSVLGNGTLILTTSTTAVRQWKEELLDKSNLEESQIGEYTGLNKDIRPVTITTYQMLTHRKSKSEAFFHLQLFDRRNWGLVIYDEVHLLPAPVFQITAEIQIRRRLGLTATLVREDGREDDVFALIGPKKVDIPWKIMEEQGWIAKAICREIRVELAADSRMDYAMAPRRQKFRAASENPGKLRILRKILAKHAGESVLVIGTYLEHLESLAKQSASHVLTGKTPQNTREALYADFRAGRLKVLFVSKVANFAVDLPDASCAIQISGTFGSRQEEAQRLGRILRPKPGNRQAHFYTLVSRDTVEQDFALKRQLFLCEQGYRYEISDEEEDEEIETGKEDRLPWKFSFSG